jgi:hypothetical protein
MHTLTPASMLSPSGRPHDSWPGQNARTGKPASTWRGTALAKLDFPPLNPLPPTTRESRSAAQTRLTANMPPPTPYHWSDHDNLLATQVEATGLSPWPCGAGLETKDVRIQSDMPRRWWHGRHGVMTS